MDGAKIVEGSVGFTPVAEDGSRGRDEKNTIQRCDNVGTYLQSAGNSSPSKDKTQAIILRKCSNPDDPSTHNGTKQTFFDSAVEDKSGISCLGALDEGLITKMGQLSQSEKVATNNVNSDFFDSEIFKTFKEALEALEEPVRNKVISRVDFRRLENAIKFNNKNRIFSIVIDSKVEKSIGGELFDRVFKKLIQAGADVNYLDACQQYPIDLACAQGMANAASQLIHAGAIMDADERDGETPLMMACKHACYHSSNEIIEVLIDNNSDVHATDFNGMLPLHKAIGSLRNGNKWSKKTTTSIGCIILLLSNGASLSQKTNYQKTPLDMLNEYKKERILSTEEYNYIRACADAVTVNRGNTVGSQNGH